MREQIKPKLRFQVFSRDGFTCQYCGRTPDQDDVVLNVDHTVSVKDGGTNDLENLVTSCRECNLGKGAKSILKRTKTIDDIKEDLNLAKERLLQITEMNKYRSSIQKIDKRIRAQETQWIRDIIGDEYSERLYAKIHRLKCKGNFRQETLSEALEIVAEKNDKHPFADEGQFLAYLTGVARNLELSDEQRDILRMYNTEIFSHERMYPAVRKMILDNSEYGMEFHNEVKNRVFSSMQNHRGETFKVRDSVHEYIKVNHFTVYKSGLNLQVLVCDTLAMVLEDMLIEDS